MKLSDFDFDVRSGSHESFKPWREDKVSQLSGNRIRLTAGGSWSAGITRPNLGLGTTAIEFDCRVMALDPYACFAIWRYAENGDEYDDCEFSAWGDGNNPYGITNTLWSKGSVVPASDVNDRNLAQSRGFRRWRVITTETKTEIGTSIYGWWWSEGVWAWKRVEFWGSFKPNGFTPGDFRIGLWVPKRGLLYPASASAPLSVTINKMEFMPL